jgi:hypothetical protein
MNEITSLFDQLMAPRGKDGEIVRLMALVALLCRFHYLGGGVGFGARLELTGLNECTPRK